MTQGHYKGKLGKNIDPILGLVWQPGFLLHLCIASFCCVRNNRLLPRGLV